MSKLLDWMIDGNDISSFEKNENNNIILSGISKINIFVGANSVGKSRIMRALYLYNLKGLNIILNNIEDINNNISIRIDEIIDFFNKNGITSIDNRLTIGIFENISLPNRIFVNDDSFYTIRSLFKSIDNSQLSMVKLHQGHSVPVNDKINNFIKGRSRRINELLKGVPDKLYGFDSFNSTYIPVLRGLRPLDGNSNAMYTRTVRDYFRGSEGKQNGNVYTGESMYKEIRSMLLGSKSKRELIRKFEIFLSSFIFHNEDVELIPREESDVVWVRIGNREEREIFNLGDGIQQVLILSFPMFTREKTFFFIEEPELNLHPGMQRKLLDAFMESIKAPNFEDNRLFFTTHSNHFLDMSLDIQSMSIFRFSENATTHTHRIEKVSNADHTTLEFLGVRKSSVLLVNATIWVEGISERWFFRRLLEIYQRKNQKPSMYEDIHFSFVEYGGANIVHYAFISESEERPIEVRYLCGRALVIADWDEGSKSERLANLETTHGAENTIIIKEVREVENLLSPLIIRQVLSLYEKVKLEEIPNFNFDDYKNYYLGSFIDNILGEKKKRKSSYADVSGTIKEKSKFWRRVLTYLNDDSFDDLPGVTKDLAARIYDFISEHNK